MKSKEQWKDIEGYEGLYQVSTWGNVRNVKRGKMLKPCKHKLGYLSVMLYKHNKPKRYNIHRLVAIAFLEKPDEYNLVNHIDEDKTNNRVSNLEWCSPEYNMSYGTIHKRLSEKRGHDARKKQPVAQIKNDGTVVNTFDSITQAAKETGQSKAFISMSCNRKDKEANNQWIFLKREERRNE